MLHLLLLVLVASSASAKNVVLERQDETDDDLPPFEDDADEANEDEADEPYDALPMFEDDECPPEFGLDLCIKVVFPNGMEDTLLLARDSPNSTVYEGILMGEADASVVLIDAPEDGERIINFDSDNSLHCDMFDVDMKTGEVSCATGYTPVNDENENYSREELDRGITTANTKGPIIPLGKYYGTSGIPLKVLFTFDSKFVTTFGDAAMDKLIALVKNAYKDKALKKLIGTTVQVTGTKKKYTGVLSQKSSFPKELQKLAGKEAKYDLYAYVAFTQNGASGVANGGVVCDTRQKERISFSNAAKTWEGCKNGNCTMSQRLALTSEIIAHEIGHNLGMAHDFDQKKYDAGKGYVYRKYQKSKKGCKGLMDYVDDGVGWSACSARDFSRYLTSGGTTNPCLNYKSKSTGNSTCSNACPGTNCYVTPSTICSNPSMYGGCNGVYKSMFAEKCKKTCNKC